MSAEIFEACKYNAYVNCAKSVHLNYTKCPRLTCEKCGWCPQIAAERLERRDRCKQEKHA